MKQLFVLLAIHLCAIATLQSQVVNIDTIAVSKADADRPEVSRRKHPPRFYVGLHTYYATNDEIKTIGHHAGGGSLSAGVFFRSGIAIGVGGGALVVADFDDEEEGKIVQSRHFPIFGEIQYVGRRRKIAPYVNIQGGYLISTDIAEVEPEHQNSNALYVSAKAGIALPLSKRKDKVALYGGISHFQVTDKRSEPNWLIAGLGFFF